MSLRFPFALLAVLIAPSIAVAQSSLADAPLNPQARAALVGVYAVRAAPSDPVVSLRVFVLGDSLMGQMSDNAPTRLMHQGANVFRPAAAAEFTIRFVVDNGRADTISIQSPEGTMTGVRSDEASLDPSRSGTLFDELAQMDSVLFDATYVACDTARINSLLTSDIEFYHDRTGFHAGDQVRADFAQLAAVCPARRGVRRELVPGTLRVYAIEGFGAIQTGVHRFVENGNPVVTVAQFTHLWKRTADGWRVSRVLSFEHRERAP